MPYCIDDSVEGLLAVQPAHLAHANAYLEEGPPRDQAGRRDQAVALLHSSGLENSDWLYCSQTKVFFSLFSIAVEPGMDPSANLIGRCANLSSWMQATSKMHDAATLRLESLGVGCPLRKRPTSAGTTYPYGASLARLCRSVL
jgi:hypothetical protein